MTDQPDGLALRLRHEAVDSIPLDGLTLRLCDVLSIEQWEEVLCGAAIEAGESPEDAAIFAAFVAPKWGLPLTEAEEAELDRLIDEASAQ